MSYRAISDLNAFRSAVVLGETAETRFLEFKEAYRWQKAKHRPEDMADQAEELSRDVAQFANRDGGTLLVGVSERAADGGRRVADAICAVDDIDGFKQWVEQAIRTHLVPATFSRSLDTIVLCECTVLAVNVKPSIELVALWHPSRKKGIEYLYRTDHGKQWMNPDEVERHIMNGSRAMQIQLARVLEEADGSNPEVELTPPVKMLIHSGPHPAGSLVNAEGRVFINPPSCTSREIALAVSVGDHYSLVRIPHGLISEAWTTISRRVGLCLRVAIVLRGDGSLSLEPAVGVT